jgi:hypothetical protein
VALNNIGIEIPKTDTIENKLSYALSAFATASGLTADENNIFWVNDAKTLGIQIKIVGSYVYVYAVNGAGYSAQLQMGYLMANSTDYLAYNVSANAGNVFAFGFAGSPIMQAAICKDDSGNVSLVGFATSTNLRIVTSTSSVDVSVANPRCKAPTVSMVKMPTIIKPVAFSDLFLVLGSPNVDYNVDAGVYVGGSLYKIIAPTTAQNCGALAFKV